MNFRLALPVLLATLFGLGIWFFWPKAPALNVVLISVDSLCRDRLGFYGHRPEYAPNLQVSPELDRLAEESAVFLNAWSTTSWTLPAHMSLMTGLSDRLHGVEADDFALDPRRRTLAQAFQDSGWQTAGFYSGPYLDGKYGFDRGFQQWQSGMMTPQELASHLSQWIENRRLRGEPAPSAEEIRGIRDRVSHWDPTSTRVNRGAQEFLRQQRKGGDPFFLFLHYFDAHYDYQPDALQSGLGQRFDPDYQGAMDGLNWYFNKRVRDPSPPFSRRISERDLGHVKALYDAEIHWVDQHIGRILKTLRELDLWDNTIVCFVSDHGDEFFEHGMIAHRSTLYPELTQIPLLLRIPGLAEDGRSIPSLTRIYDIAPTLLAHAGAKPLAEAEGLDLAPLLKGTESQARSCLQRIPGGPDLRDGWRSDRWAVHRVFEVDASATSLAGEVRFQAMRKPPHGEAWVEVHDRWEDPGELHPLPPGDPRIGTALAAFRAEFEAVEQKFQAMSWSSAQFRFVAKRGEEEEAMMQQLGYADTGTISGRLLLGPFPSP